MNNPLETCWSAYRIVELITRFSGEVTSGRQLSRAVNATKSRRLANHRSSLFIGASRHGQSMAPPDRRWYRYELQADWFVLRIQCDMVSRRYAAYASYMLRVALREVNRLAAEEEYLFKRYNLLD